MSQTTEHINGTLSVSSGDEDTSNSTEYATTCLKGTLMLSLILTDSAIDGLMVQNARREPIKLRGREQTLLIISKQIGMIIAMILRNCRQDFFIPIGIDLNSEAFTFLTIASVCVMSVPIALIMTKETKKVDSQKKDLRYVCDKTFKVFKSSATQQIFIVFVIVIVFTSIESPADEMVVDIWDDDNQMTAKMWLCQVLGLVAVTIGSALQAGLHTNHAWSSILGPAILTSVTLKAFFAYSVTFDIFRSHSMTLFLVTRLSTLCVQAMVNLCALVAFIELTESHVEGTATRFYQICI